MKDENEEERRAMQNVAVNRALNFIGELSKAEINLRTLDTSNGYPMLQSVFIPYNTPQSVLDSYFEHLNVKNTHNKLNALLNCIQKSLLLRCIGQWT